MITYRELKEKLEKLTEEQLDMNVSFYDKMNDEYYSGGAFFITDEDDVLDKNHPVITY